MSCVSKVISLKEKLKKKIKGKFLKNENLKKSNNF